MAEASLDDAELVVYAVPTQVVREVARWVAPRRPGNALQLSLAKGLELHTLLRPTEVIAQETRPPPRRCRVPTMPRRSRATCRRRR